MPASVALPADTDSVDIPCLGIFLFLLDIVRLLRQVVPMLTLLLMVCKLHTLTLQMRDHIRGRASNLLGNLSGIQSLFMPKEDFPSPLRSDNPSGQSF